MALEKQISPAFPRAPQPSDFGIGVGKFDERELAERTALYKNALAQYELTKGEAVKRYQEQELEYKKQQDIYQRETELAPIMEQQRLRAIDVRNLTEAGYTRQQAAVILGEIESTGTSQTYYQLRPLESYSAGVITTPVSTPAPAPSEDFWMRAGAQQVEGITKENIWSYPVQPT